MNRYCIVAFVVGLSWGWNSRASADEPAVIARIDKEITDYARAKGETSEQFAERVGSPLWHIEIFVYGMQRNGASAEAALRRLEIFAEALKDPEKRQLLKCLGIRVLHDSDLPPTPMNCARLRLQFGVPY